MKNLILTIAFISVAFISNAQVSPFAGIYTENIYKNNYGYSVGVELFDKVSVGYVNQRGTLPTLVGHALETTLVHSFEGVELRYNLVTIDELFAVVPSLKVGNYTLGNKGGNIFIPGVYGQLNFGIFKPMIGVHYASEYTQPTGTIRLEIKI